MKLSTIILSAVLAFGAFNGSVYAAQASKTVSTKTSVKAPIQQTVNVNTAGAEELAEVLTGVGIKKATAIVEYRKTNGKFKTFAELTNVKGIGDRTLEKNKGRMIL
ncbi:MAG: helix-hairpin-helix domain-containing protein [Gammaproteobacteria bacterium]|nr:helix-hairpin-helix domain-containing protein [Gammaproteobacteria bacterium]MDH5629868.1 helix-hairpin-helix domain-containing protein [Gammaproteobacteria bacterium]